MNGYVHETLTRRWAEETGFSAEDAEAIGLADVGVDSVYDGHLWHNKGYHFSLLGARRHAREWLGDAIRRRDVRILGQALHCEQDAISHGIVGHLWHYPGIDLWSRRSARMQARIEGATKAMMREYLSRTV